jgi:replicative DNA helicase
MNPILEKQPLHNIEAEQGLLGALISSNKHIEHVIETLQPGHFYDPLHGRIYAKVLELYNQGKPADAVSLKPYFETDPDLKKSGYNSYISDLVAGVISYSNAPHYAKIISDFHKLRVLSDTFLELQESALLADDPEELIERAELTLQKIAEDRVGDNLTGIEDTITSAIKVIERAQKGKITGVVSGLSELDNQLGGFQNGELYIIAARPGMGKTALALTLALNAAHVGYSVGFFSMEMSKAALGQRMLARYSGISTQEQRGYLNSFQIKAIKDVSEQIKSHALYIDDTTNLTIGQVRARSRRVKRRHGLDMIIVDYIGLMSATDKRANKVHQIEEITTGLKKLAKELDIPVIALSQLNRSLESRDDKRPMLSDLRDSGSIEQDADVVMLCYREEYYIDRDEPKSENYKRKDDFAEALANWDSRKRACKNQFELIIAKYRQGNACTLEFEFDGRRQLIKDIEGQSR